MGDDDPAPTDTPNQPNPHQQQRRSLLSRSLDGEPRTSRPSSGAVAADDVDVAGAAPRCASPGGTLEGAATPGPKRPAALNLQPLHAGGPLAGGTGGSGDVADDEPALDSCEGAACAAGTSSLRRTQGVTHGNHQHVYHRSHAHSPSSSMAGGLLQAVPEDAIVDSPSPSAGDPPPVSPAATATSSSGTAGGVALRVAAGSPALLGISSSFCSEISIDSPSINLTLPCHEMPSGMLVAMVDRSAEMKELYERNAPFFDQVTSCILLGSAGPSRGTDAASAGVAGKEQQQQQQQRQEQEELPPRIRQFLDTLFAPREQLPDRPWMEAIQSQLANATPAMLQTFRELVGYVDEDDDDAGIPEGDQVWLPEYDELEDTADLEGSSDVAGGSETDDDDEEDDGAVLVARRQAREWAAGCGGANSPAAAGKPSGYGPEASKEKPAAPRGKEQESGEEVTVEALSV